MYSVTATNNDHGMGSVCELCVIVHNLSMAKKIVDFVSLFLLFTSFFFHIFLRWRMTLQFSIVSPFSFLLLKLGL